MEDRAGKIWTEEMIRSEIMVMDNKTGLKGADLPIKFNPDKSALGSYCWQGEGYFTFSERFFKDPEWPLEAAINTIRHEYAHYMDRKLYGHCGHGKTWRECCMQVGAFPIACYSKEIGDFFSLLSEKKRRTRERKGQEMER